MPPIYTGELVSADLDDAPPMLTASKASAGDSVSRVTMSVKIFSFLITEMLKSVSNLNIYQRQDKLIHFSKNSTA